MEARWKNEEPGHAYHRQILENMPSMMSPAIDPSHELSDEDDSTASESEEPFSRSQTSPPTPLLTLTPRRQDQQQGTKKEEPPDTLPSGAAAEVLEVTGYVPAEPRILAPSTLIPALRSASPEEPSTSRVLDPKPFMVLPVRVRKAGDATSWRYVWKRIENLLVLTRRIDRLDSGCRVERMDGKVRVWKRPSGSKWAQFRDQLGSLFKRAVFIWKQRASNLEKDETFEQMSLPMRDWIRWIRKKEYLTETRSHLDNKRSKIIKELRAFHLAYRELPRRFKYRLRRSEPYDPMADLFLLSSDGFGDVDIYESWVDIPYTNVTL